MNDMTPLRTKLPALDAEQAETQTRLIGALNNRLIGGLRTTARAASERDRKASVAWLQFRAGDHEVAAAPLLVNGGLAQLSGPNGKPDAVPAAVVLGQIEPLIAALEQVIGKELYPIGLAAEATPGAVLLRVDASPEHGQLRNRVLIAVPPDIDIAPIAEPALADPIPAGIRLRWHAWFAGPRIKASRLETVSAGDLLLLGITPPAIRLTLPGRRNTLGARLDLQAGVLRVDDDTPDGAGAAAGSEANADWADIEVATTIEIEGSSLTAAALATLGGGSVLPLPDAGGTLKVRVRAGETVVADGELVAIGDGFGVLISDIRAAKG